MEKNIVVVDEFGINYGTTWPKRAAGLLKSGRARRIDESTICLAAPPEKEYIDFSEENKMDKKIESNEPQVATSDITTGEILSRIDRIIENSKYIEKANENIKDLDFSQMGVALNIVQVHEETNRALISLVKSLITPSRKYPVFWYAEVSRLMGIIAEKFPYNVANAAFDAYIKLEMLLDPADPNHKQLSDLLSEIISEDFDSENDEIDEIAARQKMLLPALKLLKVIMND